MLKPEIHVHEDGDVVLSIEAQHKLFGVSSSYCTEESGNYITISLHECSIEEIREFAENLLKEPKNRKPLLPLIRYN